MAIRVYCFILGNAGFISSTVFFGEGFLVITIV